MGRSPDFIYNHTLLVYASHPYFFNQMEHVCGITNQNSFRHFVNLISVTRQAYPNGDLLLIDPWSKDNKAVNLMHRWEVVAANAAATATTACSSQQPDDKEFLRRTINELLLEAEVGHTNVPPHLFKVDDFTPEIVVYCDEFDPEGGYRKRCSFVEAADEDEDELGYDEEEIIGFDGDDEMCLRMNNPLDRIDHIFNPHQLVRFFKHLLLDLKEKNGGDLVAYEREIKEKIYRETPDGVTTLGNVLAQILLEYSLPDLAIFFGQMLEKLYYNDRITSDELLKLLLPQCPNSRNPSLVVVLFGRYWCHPASTLFASILNNVYMYERGKGASSGGKENALVARLGRTLNFHNDVDFRESRLMAYPVTAITTAERSDKFSTNRLARDSLESLRANINGKKKKSKFFSWAFKKEGTSSARSFESPRRIQTMIQLKKSLESLNNNVQSVVSTIVADKVLRANDLLVIEKRKEDELMKQLQQQQQQQQASTVALIGQKRRVPQYDNTWIDEMARTYAMREEVLAESSKRAKHAWDIASRNSVSSMTAPPASSSVVASFIEAATMIDGDQSSSSYRNSSEQPTTSETRRTKDIDSAVKVERSIEERLTSLSQFNQERADASIAERLSANRNIEDRLASIRQFNRERTDASIEERLANLRTTESNPSSSSSRIAVSVTR